MARPRQPIDLVAAKGRKHLTKAEYEERKKTEITAPTDNIKPPNFLSKKEKEKFGKFAKELIDLRIMSNLDCDVLGRYVKAESEYTKITKELQKVKFTPNKENSVPEEEQMAEIYERYNFLSKMQVRLMKACNENARELGLTISSRCKLVMPTIEEEKPKNKFLQHVK